MNSTALNETRDAPSIMGHNQPPTITEVLTKNYDGVIDRVSSLEKHSLPAAIENDEQLGAVGSVVKVIRGVAADISDAKKNEKAPYIASAEEVEAFFRILTARIEVVRGRCQTLGDAYQKRKAEEARKAAEAEAKRKREEAEKLRAEEERQREIARKAEEASRPKTADRHDERANIAGARADLAEADAAVAATVANASVATLTRTRTSFGVTASARAPWVHQIEDLDAIPLAKLRAHLKREHIDAAIRLAIRQGMRELAGVRIYQDVKADWR